MEFLCRIVVLFLAFLEISTAYRYQVPRDENNRKIYKIGMIGDKPSSLCSEDSSDMEKPYRYHKETKRCYMVGDRGPCPPLMEFVIEDDEYGVCDCDHKMRCGRPLIYWPLTKRCYYVNERGPCGPGKWIVFGFNLSPTCKKNPCEHLMAQDPSNGGRFWFTFHNKCYKTYTQGYCRPGEILFNNAKEYRPTCNKQPLCTPITSSTNAMTCLPGSKKDHDGRCQRRHIYRP